MRDLRRNQQQVYFKLYNGKEEITDQYGNATGSYKPIYSGMQSAMLCVSPNKGSSDVQQFGSLEDYDRTMTTSDASCPIDENTILWVDGADRSEPYNYFVKKRAQWKNSISFAIKHVTVSQSEDPLQRTVSNANN